MHDTGSPCNMNPGPNGNDFSYGCTSSALGNLYNVSLHLNYPNTVGSPSADGRTGTYFTNFQPYLYWSCTTKTGDGSAFTGGMPGDSGGFHAFSFNTGWRGDNVSQHYMYVLPMTPGNPFNVAVPVSNGLAEQWITNMDSYDNGPGKPKGWLGISTWQLPPVLLTTPRVL